MVEILRRGTDLRYLNRVGIHRMAAMDALGERFIPSRLYSHGIVDRSEAASWEQVQAGLWTQAEAERYFDHLFDFDPRRWADWHLSGRPEGQRQALHARRPTASEAVQTGTAQRA